MSNINRITLSGRIGSDIDFKTFESGSQLASFNFASNKWDRQARAEKPLWFKVTIFGKQAEFLNNYAKKGSMAVVDGSLDVEEWEHEGEKRYKLVINANNVDLVTSCKKEEKTEENREVNTDELIGEDEVPF